MLVSRLDPKEYAWANPTTWLKFGNPRQSDIDPVFAGRLAALARHHGVLIHITGNGGHRQASDQIRAYITSGGRKLLSGAWVGGNGTAAKPGTSPHEKGLAVDTSDAWLKELNKLELTALQLELIKFGLYKPLTPGNRPATKVNIRPVWEDWHIQPIELAGLAVPAAYIRLMPFEVPGTTTDFQKAMGLRVDNVNGPDTQVRARKEYLKV